MLKKINRLGSRKEFLEVKNTGEIKQFPYWGLIKKISNNKLQGTNKSQITNFKKQIFDVKFGFIISKKISKKAVIRNKIKRKICEELRKNLDKFPDGFRGIFLVKKNIIDEKGNIKGIKVI